MRRCARRLATLLAVAASLTLLTVPRASAHPGDEILQQIYLTPARRVLTVELDMSAGVLVSRQFASDIDTDGDGTASPAETEAHLAAVGSTVTARVDHEPTHLTLKERRYPPLSELAAGVGTIVMVWTAELPAGAKQVVVTDDYRPRFRTSVQPNVLVADDPVTISAIRRSNAMRTIEIAVNADTFARRGMSSAHAHQTEPAKQNAMLDALRGSVATPWGLVLLLGACAALGALHALTPGHGKAMLASYLVAERGTPRHAVLLGLAITFTHTGAVLALGGALLAAGQHMLPARLVPALTLAAGTAVLALGIRLVMRRWADLRQGRRPHSHHHLHTGGASGAHTASLRTVAAMGVSAGAIPCPEALSVLLLAVGLNRAGLGMVMIVAFSLGLAAVLVALGLLLAIAAPTIAAPLSDNRTRWLGTRIPLMSAALVACLGCVMAVTGLSGLLR